MKKLFLGLGIVASALLSAQYYPNNGYGNQNSYGNGYGYGNQNSYGNGYGYQDNGYDSNSYFPDDYYYEYPDDYYDSNYYQNFYQDYQNSITNIQWNNFFRQYNVSPYQAQMVMQLNNMYPTFSTWNSVYRNNPRRWYYDRFYALEQILGRSLFQAFQNMFYRGTAPIAYYGNYWNQYYSPRIVVMPRYRGLNISGYRIDRNLYRPSYGYTYGYRNRNYGNSYNYGYHNGYRNNTYTSPRNNTVITTPRQSGGFRNGGGGEPGGSWNNAGPGSTMPRNRESNGFRSGSSSSSGFGNRSIGGSNFGGHTAAPAAGGTQSGGFR